MQRRAVVLGGTWPGLAIAVSLGRTLLRRTSLLDPPERTLEDAGVVARARNTVEILSAEPPRKLGPSRDELLERARATVG